MRVYPKKMAPMKIATNIVVGIVAARCRPLDEASDIPYEPTADHTTRIIYIYLFSIHNVMLHNITSNCGVLISKSQYELQRR